MKLYKQESRSRDECYECICLNNERGVLEQIAITISIGVAGYPSDTEVGDVLIDLANQALCQAKRNGCNQVVRYAAEQVIESGI